MKYLYSISTLLLLNTDVLSHWLQVWMLCKALWGHLSESGDDLHMEQGGGAGSYKHQLERRQRFSEWLSSAAEIRISQEVGGAAQGSSTETIFSYLTGYKISQACKLAQQSGL